MIWHDIRHPEDPELDRLAERYHLHPLHIEDCRHGGQRAKVEEGTDYLFVVLKPVKLAEECELEVGDLDIFLGRDYVITVLSREVISYWKGREDWLGRTPFGTLTGPKVMIVNERAGSGGDAMPWMFKKKKLGPLVGVRTWGGLVGISGYPVLMDGGSVTSASFGIVDTDGKWVVENEGVAPDVEVFETPKDYVAGKDPQLETAVRLALEALEKNPPPPVPTPGSPTPR